MVIYHFNEKVDGSHGMSYTQLRDDYVRFNRMTDDQFLVNIIDALHFACFVCWVKEQGNEPMSDRGIVHELIHLVDEKTKPDTLYRLDKIREQFNTVCLLAP